MHDHIFLLENVDVSRKKYGVQRSHYNWIFALCFVPTMSATVTGIRKMIEDEYEAII